MNARFVIDEYKEKRAILLFFYPIKKSKILFAKLTLVILFTITAMINCNILAFGIFSITESFVPLVDDNLSLHIFLRVIKISIIFAVTAAGIGVVATGMGFIKKSVPTTVITAVLLASLFGNILSDTTINRSDIASYIFMGVTIIAGITATFMLMKKVNKMEV